MLSLQLSQTTWAHKVSAGIKLAMLCAVSIALLPVDDPTVLAAALAATLGIYVTLGREALRQLCLVKPLIPILACLYALHLFTTDWQTGMAAISRLLAMILLANAVTMTTTMSEMMDAVLPLFVPLRWLGIEPAKIALAVALVIRFVPVLFAEWRARQDAWRARGGGRRSWRLLPGFCLGVLKISSNVGDALDARGFARTRSATLSRNS